jgi:ferrous iron transport protein A
MDVHAVAVGAFPLLLASEGERVRIVGFSGGEALSRRMIDLGLPIGSELAITNRQGRGAMVVAKDNLRIGLGAGMAHKVLVTSIASPDR